MHREKLCRDVNGKNTTYIWKNTLYIRTVEYNQRHYDAQCRWEKNARKRKEHEGEAKCTVVIDVLGD